MFGLLFNTFRRKPSLLRKHLDRFARRFAKPLSAIGNMLSVVTFIAAVALAVCLLIFIGFDHSDEEYTLLMRGVRATQLCFAANVVFNLAFNNGNTFKGARLLSRIINVAVLITLLPWIYPHPAHPWFPILEKVLYSKSFLFSVLILYSIVDISSTIMGMLGKRTNPSLILSASFVVFILLGSFLLMMPRCTYFNIRYIDALYLSTSAICITGLTPIDISLVMTPFGLLILGLLIQIGALGVMTFTSFFALFFSGSTSIYSQLLLRDVIYSRSMSSLIPTLFYVLGFTLAIEAAGAVMIFIAIHGEMAMTTEEEIVFAAFHSVSAFCNAGFSNLPGGMSNSTLLYNNNQSIYWVMSLLIVAGAIGFPILVNFKDVAVTYARRLWRAVTGGERRVSEVHIYSMNTKVVLVTFALLFTAGAVAFFLLESDNTMRGMTLWQRISQSVFNSVTPRSAGFTSVDPARFLSSTLVIVMLLMWIGGASQSTAGGVKVNALAAVWLNLKATITGRPFADAFKRRVSPGSIVRANAVIAISVLSYAGYGVTFLVLEPHLPARDVLFETLSALFTVGSSLGITAELSDLSKILMCTAMFLGRVGIISLMAGIAGRHKSAPGVTLPSDNIIIS